MITALTTSLSFPRPPPYSRLTLSSSPIRDIRTDRTLCTHPAQFPGIGHEMRGRSFRLWKMSPSAYQAWRKQADADAINRSQEVRVASASLSQSVCDYSLPCLSISRLYSIFQTSFRCLPSFISLLSLPLFKSNSVHFLFQADANGSRKPLDKVRARYETKPNPGPISGCSALS